MKKGHVEKEAALVEEEQESEQGTEDSHFPLPFVSVHPQYYGDARTDF